MGHNDGTAPSRERILWHAVGATPRIGWWTRRRRRVRQASARRAGGTSVRPRARLAREVARRGRSQPSKVNTVASARRIAGVLAVAALCCLMGCVSTPQGPPPGARVRQIFDPAPCEFRGTVTGGAVASETRALANARDNVARMGGNAIFVINVESQPWTFLGEEMPPNVTVTAEAYSCGSGTRASR